MTNQFGDIFFCVILDKSSLSSPDLHLSVLSEDSSETIVSTKITPSAWLKDQLFSQSIDEFKAAAGIKSEDDPLLSAFECLKNGLSSVEKDSVNGCNSSYDSIQPTRFYYDQGCLSYSVISDDEVYTPEATRNLSRNANIFQQLAEFVERKLEAVKEGVVSTFRSTIAKMEHGLKVIFEWGKGVLDKAKEFVLEKLSDFGCMIVDLWNAGKRKLEELRDIFGINFSRAQLQRTKTCFEAICLKSLNSGEALIDSVKSSAINAIHYMKTSLGNSIEDVIRILKLPGVKEAFKTSPSMKEGNKKEAEKMAKNNTFLQQVMSQSSKVETSSTTPSKPVEDNLLTKIKKEVDRLWDAIKDNPTWSRCKDRIQELKESPNLTSTLVDFICLLLTVVEGVADTIFDVSITVVTIMLDVVKELYNAFKSTILQELNWGPVRSLYLALTGSSSMSIVDVVCMILSFQTSLVCSICKTTFPIKTDQESQAFVNYINGINLNDMIRSMTTQFNKTISGNGESNSNQWMTEYSNNSSQSNNIDASNRKILAIVTNAFSFGGSICAVFCDLFNYLALVPSSATSIAKKGNVSGILLLICDFGGGISNLIYWLSDPNYPLFDPFFYLKGIAVPALIVAGDVWTDYPFAGYVLYGVGTGYNIILSIIQCAIAKKFTLLDFVSVTISVLQTCRALMIAVVENPEPSSKSTVFLIVEICDAVCGPLTYSNLVCSIVDGVA